MLKLIIGDGAAPRPELLRRPASSPQAGPGPGACRAGVADVSAEE
jgi:hypothetical protein